MTTWRVPLFDADFGPEEEAAVLRPLRAGWLTMGEEVLCLEQELCEASGARHAVAVSNCTAALHLACAALGVGLGDEVLCPTLTFVASANAPRSLGAEVRLCESIGEDDLTVDPASVAALLGPRTKAIIAVHYAGFACRMEEILELADARGVPVIEDCAHALFTTYHGKTLGLHGRVGCFSFFSNKNITCGEGGALLTDDGAFADDLRRLRSHGMTSPTLERHKGRAYSYDVTAAGFNYRLDEIRAALLRAQLRRLPGFLRRRRELYAHYAMRLGGTPVRLPFLDGRRRAEHEQTAIHLLPALLPPGVDRTTVMARLKEAGVQSSIHYPPIHTFTAYRQPRQELPHTEALARRELSLPFYPAMTEADVDFVVETLLAALATNGRVLVSSAASPPNPPPVGQVSNLPLEKAGWKPAPPEEGRVGGGQEERMRL
jgi:dTDP-4-amino-4,6-dideoxygalactose transaminase